MIPLVYFLAAWGVFMGVFALMSFITVVMNVRYGLTGFVTYLTTGVFITVSCLILMGVGLYFTTVDWSASVDLLPSASNILEL